MGFYELSEEEKKKKLKEIEQAISKDVQNKSLKNILAFAADNDTHIRKKTYTLIFKTFRDSDDKKDDIFSLIKKMLVNSNEKIRQTAVFCLGEIGKTDAEKVFPYLEKAMSDPHHSVRNAVVGSLKQMSEKNPGPTIKFVQNYLDHPDSEIRREIIHGIELRGRTHPEDVLPVLKKVQNDPDKKVRDTIIHVISQISYKDGCLEKVVEDLKTWRNNHIVKQSVEEIIKVHERYEKFSAKSLDEASEYIEKNL